MMDDAFLKRLHFIRNLRRQAAYLESVAAITTVEDNLRFLGYIPTEDFFPYDFFDATFPHPGDDDDEDDMQGVV